MRCRMGQVTEPKPVRGPDFLPYPLPNRDVVPAEVVPEPLVGSRWSRTLEGLTPWGLTAVIAAIIALVCVLVLSLPGHRGSGALLASVAALVAIGAGVRSFREQQPADSRSLVTVGMVVGLVSALVALLLLGTHRSAIADAPPVQTPFPLSTTAPQPQLPQPLLPQPQPPQPNAPNPATPSPGAPGPSPSTNGLNDGVFGVPSLPGGAPMSNDPTSQGTLSGRVLNLSGAAVAGATITITRADPTDVSGSPVCPVKQTVTSNAKGKYTVQLCQLGNNLGYHVVITSGSAQVASNLYINSGQTTTYDVILAIRHA